MKVTVYVNWNEQKILTENEYKEELNRRAEDFCADDASLADWLEEHYNFLDLYYLKDSQKEEVRKAFFEESRNYEEDWGFGNKYEKFTFKV